MAAPTPRVRSWRRSVAPAARASSSLPSSEASETTTISETASRGIFLTTRPILPFSLKTGAIATMRTGPSIAKALPDLAPGLELHDLGPLGMAPQDAPLPGRRRRPDPQELKPPRLGRDLPGEDRADQ